MKNIVLRAFEESIRVKERFIKENVDGLVTAARRLACPAHCGRICKPFYRGAQTSACAGPEHRHVHFDQYFK